jgi:hypothetical protein
MGFTVLVITALVCILSRPASFTQANQTPTDAAANIMNCRALEAHASALPAVTVVVFHQRDKQDQERLGTLLRQNNGASVELQVGKQNGRRPRSSG